jgi:hypothetical protein
MSFSLNPFAPFPALFFAPVASKLDAFLPQIADANASLAERMREGTAQGEMRKETAILP